MVGHANDYYLSAFVLIFALVSLAPLLDPNLPRRKFLASALVLLYTFGAVTELALTNCDAIQAALHRSDFHDDPQWRLAAAISAHGLRYGDPVAVIRDGVPPYRCHWAYVSGVRIIAELGALPFRVEPVDRMRFERPLAEPAFPDYGQTFWTELSTELRARVIAAFRAAGAHAVISLSTPQSAPPPGWLPLTGTSAWVHDL